MTSGLAMRMRLVLLLVPLLPPLPASAAWFAVGPDRAATAFEPPTPSRTAPPAAGARGGASNPAAAPYSPARAAPGGRMLLATRGFARVVADGKNTGKEAQTLFRVEFPC